MAGSADGNTLTQDVRSARLRHVVGQLVAGLPDMLVDARVLDTGTVCAYAWPNGTIYVTRGLMDCADDDIIAAAVAHEMGHLLGDGHLPAIASLKGCTSGQDAEVQADTYGMGLLRLQHLSDDSMARMLTLVLNSNNLSSDCRATMMHRIALATRQSNP